MRMHDPKSLSSAVACNTAHCSVCAGSTAYLFSGVEPALLGEIQHAIDTFHIKRGARIYRVGDAGQAIFTVRKGLVKLVQYLPDGTSRIVRLLHSADVAGLEALLGEPYLHDAVVEQDAQLCRIPVHVVRRLEQQSPQLYRELMRRWQRALAAADAWLTELSTGSARQRLARLLLRLSDADGRGLCRLFGRRDMAAMLGLTMETVSRLVAEFRRDGLLVEEAGKFHCPVAELRSMAED